MVPQNTTRIWVSFIQAINLRLEGWKGKKFVSYKDKKKTTSKEPGFELPSEQKYPILSDRGVFLSLVGIRVGIRFW